MKLPCALVAMVCCSAALAIPQLPPAAAIEPLSWIDNLKDGQKQALENRQPMLVIFGAEWCGPCRLLDKEIAKPAVQEKLRSWTRVHLDVDKTPNAAELIGGQVAIPHLKVMTATGRTVASQTGFMDAEELIKWLAEHFDQATAGAGEELTGVGPPSSSDLPKLLDHLKQSEPALREAALRRLVAHQAIAASGVVEAFEKGNLATRLSVLELLSTWKAPIGGIDPWRPETVSADRIDALRRWARPAKSATPATRPAALSPAELQQARLEMARLLETTDDGEAHTIRERLARLGPEIAGEVRQQLNSVQSDALRAKLGALRYRLAMSDALALAWPSGVEQLASSDQTVRRAAMMELQKRASAADAKLLLELFGDPDPLVRQMSLRTLASVVGAEASGALLGLLADADASVRTEVLKQLSETPVRSVVGKVAEYALAEKNSELVVHAVRVFRAAKGSEARQVLLKLTGHESWRVRAEAAEALHEIMGGRGVRRQSDPEVHAAMMKLLEDKDSFVVSRAAMVLQQTNPAASLEAVMKAVEEHPELAADVLERLGEDDEQKGRALPYLMKLAAHPEALVRAAAVKGLAGHAQAGGQQIAKALRDGDERVRVAAAEATFEALEELRPKDGVVRRVKRKLFVLGANEVEEKVDTNKWLAEFRAGKDRPAWVGEASGDLEKMLESTSERERLSAAQALVALGKEPRALPMLVAGAKSGEQWKKMAGNVLPWLLIEKRLEVFAQLLALAGDDRQKGSLVDAMAEMPDRHVRNPLWEVLRAQRVSGELASSVQQALLKLYLTEQHYNLESVPKALVAETIAETKERAVSGPDIQRAVAMAILLTASAQDAAEVAGKIYRDAGSSEVLREDALHVMLSASEKAEATRLAIEALGAQQDSLRGLALAHLAGDQERLGTMRSGPHLWHSREYVVFPNQQSTPDLRAPTGLREENLRPFLKAGGKQGAQAAYLLALLGRNEGMDLLIGQWRQDAQQDEGRRLVYRAVAALNDEKYVPVLEEIYSKMDKEDYGMREFYWTIRSMTGARVLALRKKIRDEVGMENLK